MSYKKKLERFNSTDKYKQEMEFMAMLINPYNSMPSILDYGCGTGYMVKRFNGVYGDTYGYDPGFKYLKYPKDEIFRDKFEFKFDHIYFMHSLAHISDIETVLNSIKDMLTDHGKVHVMTPNKLWLDIISKNNYEADPTVVKHFTPISLETLFYRCTYNINQHGQYGNIIENQHERLFLTATKYE